MTEHLCRIPCGVFPKLSETDFSKALKPVIHPNRTVDFNVLIYLIDGEMEIYEDGRAYVLKPNTLFFLKQGVHHWGEKPFAYNTSWYYVHFDFPESGMITHEMPSRQRFSDSQMAENDLYRYHMTLPKSIDCSANSNVKYLIKQVVQQYQMGNFMRSAMLLMQILLDCYEKSCHENHLQVTHAKISPLVDFLHENYASKLSHEEIEAKTGLSFKYLSVLFKEQTGKTIKQYQLELRLKRAVVLLCETNLPIAEISRQTGFYDEFYFSRIFKREFGTSPLRYRKTYTPRI